MSFAFMKSNPGTMSDDWLLYELYGSSAILRSSARAYM